VDSWFIEKSPVGRDERQARCPSIALVDRAASTLRSASTGIRSRYATVATGVLPYPACSRVRAPRSTPIAAHGIAEQHRLACEVAARVAPEEMYAQQEPPPERQRAIQLARDEPRRVPAIQDSAQGRSFRPLGPKGRGCCAQRPLRDASALVVNRAWSRRTGAAYNPHAESPRPRARFTSRAPTKPCGARRAPRDAKSRVIPGSKSPQRVSNVRTRRLSRRGGALPIIGEASPSSSLIHSRRIRNGAIEQS
jgi:hypothetical protein